MKTYTETVVRHEGEWFPLDENFDYMGEKVYPNNPEIRKEKWELFLKCAKNPKGYKISTDYMFAPKEIIDIGMYDGWPHWKPYPSFSIVEALGVETYSWYQLNHIKEVKE